MSAVIYARYSSDRQRETSIDDQIRVCRVRAELLGLTVIVELGPGGIDEINVSLRTESE